MTTQNFFIKWLAYALALLPVWFAEAFLLSRYPLFGVKAMLLPLAAVAVATLEGASAGAGFGLAVGVLFDAVTFEVPGVGTLLLTGIGLFTGLLSRYFLRQNLAGCFLCSAGALVLIDGFRVAVRLLPGAAPIQVLALLAGKEIAWSLCFVPPVYLIFRWVFQRVPKPTVL